MKKIEKITKADSKNNIFTEEVNYHTTGDASIWGSEDPETVKYLLDKKFSGRWLDLCAGDGRFMNRILQDATQIFAADIDQSALSKLYERLDSEQQAKVILSVLDVTKQFPFVDNYFDGVFCVGTLHLFSEKVLENIFIEVERVLDSGKSFIIDFATDIKRQKPDGSLLIFDGEASYSSKQAEETLKRVLSRFEVNDFVQASVYEDLRNDPVTGYEFSCNYFIVRASKS